MRPINRIAKLAGVLVTVCAVGLGGSSSLAAIKLTDGTYALDMQLSRPTTIAPANGAALTYPTNPIKLSWRPVPGAAKYDVQIAQQPSSDVNCNSAEAWASENILFTHQTDQLGWVPELTSKETGSDIWTGTFCWRVRAAAPNAKVGAGTWSSSNRFTVSWPARPTNLKFFADESGDIPRAPAAAGETTGFDTGYLEWDAIPGASRYEVQISRASNFSAGALFATKTYPGTRLLLPQMPDNRYFWRVRPVAGNGVTGSWSDMGTFIISRDARYWESHPDDLYPADGETTDDVRIGWEPVPGASYYRFMVSASSSGFTEWQSQAAYIMTPNAAGICVARNARISSSTEADSSTINNWASLGSILAPEVFNNFSKPCTEGKPTADAPALCDCDKYLPIPSTFYWQVMPVWQLKAENETGWAVQDTKIFGQPKARRLNIDHFDGTDATSTSSPINMVDNNQCNGMDCLRLFSGRISPRNAATDSTTMQVPYLGWGAYAGPGGPGGVAPFYGPGGYRVQVAEDRLFNRKVGVPRDDNESLWPSAKGPLKYDASAGSTVGMNRFGAWHRSFAFTTGLPDEGLEDNDGYYWRAFPCSASHDTLCGGYYEPINSTGMQFGVEGSGALTFQKRVTVSTAVVPDFSAGMPLLKVGPQGASHHSQWQRGIQGADHYEFELARNQSFDGSKVLKTSVPRIVPWGATPADLLEPGTWFWRVRAVDRDGLTGTWSSTSSFSVGAAAPVISNESAGAGVGATVEWSPVAGATSYEISYGSTTAETRQTAYHIPSSTSGTFTWRVRAKTGASAFGSWSAPRAVTILAPTRVPVGVSRRIVSAGQTAIVEGQLVVAGATRNGQRVWLQRKSAACAEKGEYSAIDSYVSGNRLDDGMVRFRPRVPRSFCYRLAWKHATGTVYSAAFSIGARPVVAFRPTVRTVKRGRSFCAVITSRQPLTGTLRVQYRVGRTWVNARTAAVRGMKRRIQCAAINRGGVFPVRIQLTNLKHPRTGKTMYETTWAYGGTIRTNDQFTIIR